MKKYVALKLVGLAILTMAALVLFSILEVAIYSYFINPGQATSVYDAHAELTAPYISGIFGFIIFFLAVRYWKKRKVENVYRLTFLFPFTYIVLDMGILLLARVDWQSYYLIVVLANGAKIMGSYLGYKLTK